MSSKRRRSGSNVSSTESSRSLSRSATKSIPIVSSSEKTSTARLKRESYKKAYFRVVKNNERLEELLDRANECIKDLAREYKRLLAIAQAYKDADNSLLCSSQSQQASQSQNVESIDPIPLSQGNLTDSQISGFEDLILLSQTSDALFDMASEWRTSYSQQKEDALTETGIRLFSESMAHVTPNSGPTVRVGVGCIVINPQNCILIGCRKETRDSGLWGLPGGHLRAGESFEHCASRELEEETGLKLSNFCFVTVTNDIGIGDEKQHYVSIYMQGNIENGFEPDVREPEKCSEWKWVLWSELKLMAEKNQSLFPPLQNLICGGYSLPNS